MTSTIPTYQIEWEKLPDDFILPDDPVDNIHQPALAAALTDSLENAGKIPDNAITTTNYGICATVNGKIVVKAPDWAYIPLLRVPKEEIARSYTPQLQGETPIIVMEFLSDTDGSEYSSKPTHPPGKWFFYEKILQVPHYIIFEPYRGLIEHYQLGKLGEYEIQSADDAGRYWIPQLKLYLGLWDGRKEQRKGYWLRWWTETGDLLLWGSELVIQERQKAEVERQKAEVEKQKAEVEKQQAEVERQKAEVERQKAERLAAQLRAAGIEPEL
ncbi:Uma2 family endonuclease [Crocosphaera sp. UHCC 0190]|uniref:Uma2 family endonuclease n=1 Tax=Crocosphaera sp. UHCC 0190 TaxID=3110246 RepID=UPI002B1EBA59|nr:Uma2 family endonuclease [Crocosphaera sp. UHCC 0190]MEA5510514.1 Uma2 family endonuclease [Crocosphaera sp. UHCC 0190]